MDDLIEYVFNMIKNGYTSGYHPEWSMEKVDGKIIITIAEEKKGDV